MSKPLEYIEVGKSYRVEIDDCCVKGEFVAEIQNLLLYGEEEVLKSSTNEYGLNVFFTNNVKLICESGVSFYEVEQDFKSKFFN